ncbi:helix-turn-helix domain-containing protein [Mycolicibacterium vaccae]|uniref:helix-turn-helix domain-containing protein n=1 Tax=Mycolicibacterium vaccae TaxID=1810 RepID=UPI0009DB34DE|nr:helix-turn-helix domain-containing protein [Mycolicibacterium vaccae]MCV7060280.1 helix-turn-helix domain-containing protein [Mycolicibacterium vaccae]
MTDFSQCWFKQLDDSGTASRIRPASLLVTRAEAARILSISVPEIDNLRRAGRLLAKKHGARVLFPMVELERYAESLPWEVDLRG